MADALQSASDTNTTNYSLSYSLAISENLNYCADTDGDGIPDLTDIDDDNDGIIDAVESPDCFYATTHELIESISSPFTSTEDIGLLYNGVLEATSAGYNVTTAVTAANNLPGTKMFTISYPYGVELNSITTSDNLSGTAGATADIYGSYDGSTWYKLTSTAQTIVTASGTTFTLNQNPGAYQYYAIQTAAPVGGAAIATTDYIAEIKGDISNYSPSMYPQPTCDSDLDGDNIPNYLDLDSDGDGCYDSYEAGVTDATYNGSSTDSITAGPYGGNGLADALQSASDTNTTNYSLSYSLAISENLNYCADTDGDGIPDLTDIDDDNDGIIDAVESPDCFYASSYELIESISSPFTSTEDIGLLYNGVLEAAAAGYNVTTAVTAANNLPGTKMFTISYPYGVELNSITTSDNLSGTAGATADIYGSYDGSTWFKLTSTAQNIQTASGATFTLNQNPGAYQYYAIQTAAPVGGAAIATTDYIAEIKGNINHYSPSMYPQPTCDSDLDGDNTPNYLDLDSDGDGCYDSYEAGVTDATYNGSSTDSITAGPYGGNGLADALQSASDTNTTNYSLSYSLAISENLNYCADTDGDGIPDLTDIDDDNDGIIDAVESPDCFYATTHELIESISSPFTSTEDIGLLYNGVLEATSAGYNVTTAVTAANNLPGTKMFTISYPYGVELNSITTSDNLSGTAGATADIYGSYDGSTWFKLTSTAQNIQTASGATFTLNQNPGSYQYYAIQTAAPVGGAAIATTDYIAEIKGNISNYSPSMYPQPTCDSDLDGDNIPNYLDLDSDGDGCFDSYEARIVGATYNGSTTDSISAGPYGGNGFADVLQNTIDTNTYKQTYSYGFVIDGNTNACTDTDGDGIADVFDIDDDNDGILDVNEMQICDNSLIVPSSASVPNYWAPTSSDLIQTINGVDYTLATTLGTAPYGANSALVNNSWFSGAPSGSGVSNDNTPYDNILTYNFESPINSQGIVIWNTDANDYGGEDAGIKDFSIKVTKSDNTTQTFGPYTAQVSNAAQSFNFPIVSDVSKIELLVTDGWYGANAPYVSAKDIGAAMSVNYNMTLNEFRALCANVDIDTDGDGIPNRLDLDSDGDGCYDSYEAGVTGATFNGSTTDSITAGPYGGNGLADALQSVADTNTTNYSLNYNLAISENLNLCADTDGDGIPYLTDIDDDNDGILDAVESPECYYTEEEATKITSISTDIAPYLTNTIDKAIDESSGTYAAFANDGGSIGDAIFTITPAVATAIASIEYDPQSWGLSNGTDAFKLQGFNGVSWTDLSGNTSITATTGVQTINNTVDLTTAFQSYRIVITAGSNYYGGIKEIRINAANYVPSAHPKEICNSDVDGDDIPNYLDLDSDGDGCYDSYEAGVTGATLNGSTTDSITAGPYGGNGFANVLQSTTDTNTYKLTYSYRYVTDSNTNACTDTDGDGIADVFDLDDDNDGILDVNEMTNCGYVAKDLSTMTFNGTAVTSVTSNTITSANTYWPTSYSDQDLTLPIHLEYKITNASAYSMFGLLPSGSAQVPNNYNDTGYKFYNAAGTVYGAFPNQWTFTQGAVAGEIYSIDIDATGYVTAKIDGVIKAQFQGVNSTYKLDVTAHSTQIMNSIILTDGSSEYICNELDTDGDSIPNRLDLDSDGDGCYDSYEAGVTGATFNGSTTDSIASGPYGGNGLADALQSVADTNTTNYSLNYNLAISENLNLCADTDGDGIPDLTDIDDDNDGILDAVESPECYYTEEEATKITSISTDIAPYLTNTIDKAIDESSGTYAAFANDGGSIGDAIFTITPAVATAIASIEYDPQSWGLSNGTDAFKLQGFNGVSWTDLSGNTSITATTGVQTINNTVDLTTAFQSYRIVITAGSNYYGGIKEIRINAANYVPSAHPKEICNSDVDGDDIPNYLDLDSDGDGCYDSYEAGVTGATLNGSTTDSITAGPYGGNGLANALQSASDTNTTNYSSNYNLAINENLNLCLDTDGDGIGDLIDIDDDNDGVLDTVECPAFQPTYTELLGSSYYAFNSWVDPYPAPASTSNMFLSGGNAYNNPSQVVDGNTGSYIHIIPHAYYGGTRTNWGAGNVIAFRYDFLTDMYLTDFKLYNDNGEGADGIKNFQIDLYNASDSLLSTLTGVGPASSTSSTYPLSSPLTVSEGYYYIITISSQYGTGPATGGGIHWREMDFIGTTTLPVNCDLDGDGIPNTLDLDSDGDGCSDATEAGVTGILLVGDMYNNDGMVYDATGVIAEGPYGTNGLANSVETNDSLNAGVTYNSSYLSAALDKDVLSCPILLPVEFLYFDAVLNQENMVECSWATVAEINNDYFLVLRSQNGNSWEEIGKVSGNGNSRELNEYSFLDENPFKGISYYRLKQVDFDGAFEYSEIRSVNLVDNEINQISIYPNPTKNVFYIESTTEININDIQIFNTVGAKIDAGKLNLVSDNSNKISVQTNDLPVGLYFVHIKELTFSVSVIK